MSVAFPIPATSFVLKSVIEAQLKAAYGDLSPPSVHNAPPPRLPAPPATGTLPTEPAALYLFLHGAGPNASFRSSFDPTFGPDGLRQANPPLVLDLHYMLAATGNALETEALLGLALTALTRNAILARGAIEAILSAVASVPDSTDFMDYLFAEPLHDPASQPEELKTSLNPVDIDTVSKIWSALQSPMRPSILFMTSAVFLDPNLPLPDPAPVGEARVTVGARSTPQMPGLQDTAAARDDTP